MGWVCQSGFLRKRRIIGLRTKKAVIAATTPMVGTGFRLIVSAPARAISPPISLSSSTASRASAPGFSRDCNATAVWASR